jgi:hypothetical protein
MNGGNSAKTASIFIAKKRAQDRCARLLFKALFSGSKHPIL